VVEFPIVVTGIDHSESGPETVCFELQPGDIFMLLDALEIDELSVIEVQILFENYKMWFNIHKSSDNIRNVRRAGSYDIPFMTLQEPESGSNSLFD
tara:strand:- start:57 stop:344 length:288 start_codon:yes stop_codon:yes gene_type:complete